MPTWPGFTVHCIFLSSVVQVLSHDQLGRDDFMGERIIELGQIDWSEITTRWFELEAEVGFSF